MAAYYNGAAQDYDFERFENHSRTVSASAAPKRKVNNEPPVRKPELRIVENKNKRKNTDSGESIRNGVRSAVIMFFAVMVLAVIGLQIHAGARSYELSQQIETVEKKIAEAETENVRLNNVLNSITTIDNIDAYARNILGMTKSESYQIKCIDLSDGDKVLYSSAGFSPAALFDRDK